MGNNLWYEVFLETLNKKYPKKQDLLQALMDLLFIEREAVYRRLRQDVIFTAHEIMKIAEEWHISLDSLIGINSGVIPFQMRMLNYLEPSDEEMKFLRQVVDGLHLIKNYPDTQIMVICNKLPRQITARYPYLNRYYLFKWLYHYSFEKEVIPFSKVVVSKERFQVTADYSEVIKSVPDSSYIWDRHLLDNLISDIQFFHSIRMITDEEKNLIKKDLSDLLDYVNEMANEGHYPETKNKVNLYISDLNIDTNYSYTFSKEANICFIQVFEKYEIYTFDQSMVTIFKKWMQMKKKTSVQISEVDLRTRINFFAKKRQVLDKL